MKIIFLDFDGVLNSIAFASQRTRTSLFGNEDNLDPQACALLQNFLNLHPEAQVVISSTWRKRNSLVELQRMLAHHGIDSARVFGVTPVIHNQPRGTEIQAWLDLNPTKSFVILDDDADMAHLISHLVQTNLEVGLTTADLARASEILSK